ncbi:MAG: EAL domain-containing protein, partial [Gammaproteobacteria bacterium]|nr:EAL domain-containing protein [Gammaproteobacteria bacterium]
QAEPSIYSCRIVDRNAATKWADINVVTITWENEIATLTFISDITSQKEAEFALVESELRYRSIFETSVGAIIVVQGDNGNITEWNAGAQHIFGYQYDEVVGKPVSILLPARYQKAHQAGFDKAVARGELAKSGIRHELNGIRNDGTEFPIELTLSSFQREAEVYFSASILDISERKQAEQQLLHQAHYDNLTGLPNRFLSLDRLSQLLIDAKRESTQVAVIFIDLDDFKKVNDTLGHEAGDMMLREAAARLESVVRSGDTVGRLGGDEFIVLLGNLDTAAEVQPVSENLLETFRNPFVIENREIILTSSLGVAMYPDDGFDASELLRNADAAMYNSKDIGRNTYSFFTESMNMYVQRRLELEEHIHSALDRGEFKVYFQAQIDIATENIVGAEALLRWYNPQLGSISPDEFIPVAEHTGIIIPIGKYVLEEALAMAARWQKEIIPDFKIAVNLSPRQFRDPELVSVISESVKKAKLPYANLELEITEGVLISGHGFMEQALQDIGKLGIQIAMDDFGTGYSSLNYLRKYPFDALKIDRSFIFDISTDAADRELIAATIAMAHALGLSVVAEGIETQEQLKFLKNLNCDFGQGYLFGKPVSANEFSSLLKKS